MLESDGLPELHRGQVVQTPERDSQVASASGHVLELGHKPFPVLDLSGILSHPNLEATQTRSGSAEHAEADQIAIAKQSKATIAIDRIVHALLGQEAYRLGAFASFAHDEFHAACLQGLRKRVNVLDLHATCTPCLHPNAPQERSCEIDFFYATATSSISSNAVLVRPSS